MESDSLKLLAKVKEAKQDSQAADELISAYMPFIKSETAKFLKRAPVQEDDELSIAMFAFYEAICSYSALRGAFLRYAALQIRSRLIDYYRREQKNRGQISLDDAQEDETPLLETIADTADAYEETDMRDATRQEIAELTAQMEAFGVTLNDVADHAPQQTRSLAACQKAVSYAKAHPEILEDFLRTKRVPLEKIAKGAEVEKKTLERHRRYLVAVLLICTNGYEILRGHLKQVLRRGENP